MYNKNTGNMTVYNRNTGTTSKYHYNSNGRNGYYYTGRVVVNPVRYPAWGWNRGVVWAPVGTYWGGGFWGAFAVGAATAAVMGSIYYNNQTYTSYHVQCRQPRCDLAVELRSAASSVRAAWPGRHLRAQLRHHLRKSESARRCRQLRSQCRQLDNSIAIMPA